jgi:ATP-dependent RNA helicase DeaD
MLQGASGTPDKKPSSAPSAKSAPVKSPATESAQTEAPAPRAAKTAPSWAKQVASPKARDHKPAAPETVRAAATPDSATAEGSDEDNADSSPKKSKYERPARTGREPGMTTLYLNVGRKQLVTPADIVGKISGVTRLNANVVGAIDIHQRHTLVDVAESESAFIVQKLGGIKLKGIALEAAVAGPETK